MPRKIKLTVLATLLLCFGLWTFIKPEKLSTPVVDEQVVTLVEVVMPKKEVLLKKTTLRRQVKVAKVIRNLKPQPRQKESATQPIPVVIKVPQKVSPQRSENTAPKTAQKKNEPRPEKTVPKTAQKKNKPRPEKVVKEIASADDKHKDDKELVKALANVAKMTKSQQVTKGKKVDFASYSYTAGSMSFQEFCAVARRIKARLFFLKINSQCDMTLTRKPFLIRPVASGINVTKSDFQYLKRLCNTDYTTQYIEVMKAPALFNAWRSAERSIKQRNSVSADYRMVAFFPYDFIAKLEAVARTTYTMKKLKPLSFEKGAGTITFTIASNGTPRIVSMGNIQK